MSGDVIDGTLVVNSGVVGSLVDRDIVDVEGLNDAVVLFRVQDLKVCEKSLEVDVGLIVEVGDKEVVLKVSMFSILQTIFLLKSAQTTYVCLKIMSLNLGHSLIDREFRSLLSHPAPWRITDFISAVCLGKSCMVSQWLWHLQTRVPLLVCSVQSPLDISL